MKDLGSLKYFVGIEVSQFKSGIFMSQIKYTINFLHEIDMSSCRPIATPMEEGLKLEIDPIQVSVDKSRYHRLVGKLMYV